MFTIPFKGMTRESISQIYHPGHLALDIISSAPTTIHGYGTPLCAPERCQVIHITGDDFTNDDADLEHGYGIFLKGLETGYTHLYWHTLPLLPVKVGDIVERGQIVAFMGNAGMVYSDGVYVPLEQRLSPSKPGTHLHWEVIDVGYILGRPKKLLDPFPMIDFSTAPSYSFVDLLTATLAVLRKRLSL